MHSPFLQTAWSLLQLEITSFGAGVICIVWLLLELLFSSALPLAPRLLPARKSVDWDRIASGAGTGGCTGVVDIAGVVVVVEVVVVVVDGVVGGNVMIREERSNIGAIDGGGRTTGLGCCQWPSGECWIIRKRGWTVIRLTDDSFHTKGKEAKWFPSLINWYKRWIIWSWC